MQNYVSSLIVYCTGCEVGRYGEDCRPCRGCLTCDVSSGFCSKFIQDIELSYSVNDKHEFNRQHQLMQIDTLYYFN